MSGFFGDEGLDLAMCRLLQIGMRPADASQKFLQLEMHDLETKLTNLARATLTFMSLGAALSWVKQ